jgi:outer membrane protein, multidrug efflux system
MRALTTAIAGVLLAACAVGPDYVRPDPQAPSAFVRSAATDDVAQDTAASTAARDDVAFWRGFGDPQLASLIDDTLVANHDLRIALSRFDAANAMLRGARFDRWPTITAQGSASDARASADQIPGVARDERDGESYSAGVRLGWELDLFGRVRRSVEAQRAQTGATAADLQALRVSLVAEVANEYITLRGLQERLIVARQSAQSQAETLDLVERSFSAGRGTEFDTARTRAQLETTAARIPALEAQIAFTEHRLAVLVGKPPGALIDALESTRSWPNPPTSLDPGTPGELLRRRPDIAAAEHRLHAATARIGVATADLFPRFTLGGLIGTQAIDSSDLFGRDSETRLVALGVDWSFLDVGRVRARIAASDADAAGELARYEQTVLLALEETESALVRYAKAQLEDQHLQRAAADSARAAALARTRNEAGVGTLLDVLDAERSNLQAQDAMAQSRAAKLGGVIQLYRAMAGGWPSAQPTSDDMAQVAPAIARSDNQPGVR